jgi:DNA (cytosine-5)-methyltransferase 1
VRVLDLFAGCGGLSLGLSSAGFDVTNAVELDAWAADTYHHNHPHVRLLRKDISTISSRSLKRLFGNSIDVIAGGPPCQGFSVSGKRQYGLFNPDNALLHDYIRCVEVLRPRIFILENVRGFVSATIEGRTRALHHILKRLTQIGYDVHHQLLNAADYGVPQTRTRLFIVGSLTPIESPFPAPTHSPDGRMSTATYVTVDDAISDLPQIHAGEGTDSQQPYPPGARTAFARTLKKNSQGVFNHEAMKHTRRLVQRFESIAPGDKSYDLGRCGASAATVTVYKSNNQRLVATSPSLCITANWQSSYIHPWLHRNLTVREAARLQSFPDTFVFKGKRAVLSAGLMQREGRLAETFLSQCHQVGNAVPPMLAAVIGKGILAALARPARKRPKQKTLW